MPLTDYLIYILLLAGVALSIWRKKLTVSGAITGGVIGLLIFKGGGYTGIAMLTSFFVVGSWATGWQMNMKQKARLAEHDKGKRTASQVIANGGVAAMFGALAWYRPEYAALFQLMMAGSLAAATADTLSSELGTVYGKRFYDIISFKKVKAGPDGVVSLEGTLIGAAGAVVIAFIYLLGNGFTMAGLIIVAAGIIGNLADSVLGATLERRGIIGNNIVNFLNTLTGALICAGLLAGY
jgi:uncharacterized protein (TIGR00297 family)